MIHILDGEIKDIEREIDAIISACPVMTVEMKKPQAAEYFGVTQGTISNWVKEA